MSRRPRPATRRSFVLKACTLATMLGIAAPSTASAQSARPTTFVVAFAPGGVVDAMTRAVARKMGEGWGAPVLVDNRAGGGTVIGTQAVANAVPDGRTLLVTSMAYVTNPFLIKPLPYAADALEPLALIATAPNILLIHPSVQAASVKELVALAKVRPGSVTLGSAGNGSSQHMTIELFSAETGAEFLHVPYKGTAPALADALGGQISGMFDSSVLALDHVKTGKLKALAVTSPRRLAAAPNVPTVAEAGYPALQALTWVGIFVPRATPEAEKLRLFTALQATLRDKDVQEAISSQGFQTAPAEPGSFARYLAEEQARWGQVIKVRRITNQ